MQTSAVSHQEHSIALVDLLNDMRTPGYCMQDVCISFWKEDGSSDMMLKVRDALSCLKSSILTQFGDTKVTDICSTDPNDPTSCATPADIKVERGKAQVMEGLTQPPDITAHPELMGDSYPEQIWWFFMKCWDDVREPQVSATVYLTLTTIINRALPNQPTRATTGSQTLLCQTISSGPKIAKLNKLKTTKLPMQPTAGQPILTALTIPKGTTRPHHPSQIGLLETRLPHGVRLLEAKAGASLIRSAARTRLRLKSVLLRR